MEHNICAWFEIPVNDIDRAIKFYESVLVLKMQYQDLGVLQMAWFPHVAEKYGSGGALVSHPEHYIPSENGIIIYLSTSSGDLNADQKSIEDAGGKILSPRKQISPEHGFMLLFKDTEGNRLALHSNT